MVTGVGWGPLECYDGNRGRLRLRSTRVYGGYKCRLRVSRAAMLAMYSKCHYYSTNHFIFIRAEDYIHSLS